MTARIAVLAGLLAAGIAGPAVPQGPAAPPTEPELQAHVKSLRQRIDDDSLALGYRERLTLELAATLDRAAQTAPDDAGRRAYWGEAVAALDDFRNRNPNQGLNRPFAIQAAVYLWARARAEKARLDLKPDDQARDRAATDLQDAIVRLRSVAQGVARADDVYAQNARFRLAQALTDLAEVAPGTPETARGRYAEALEAIAAPLSEPALQGFAGPLRVKLYVKLGNLIEAQRALDQIAKRNPPPPPRDLLDARLALLEARGQYPEALKAIDDSPLDPSSRADLRLRLRLAQRLALPASPERSEVETALFRDLRAARASRPAQAAPALAEAARAINEPAAGQDPSAWDLLAEGALALGQPARAGELERQAATLATAAGRKPEARDFALKAGAAFFQAARYADADPWLRKVAQDPDAGPLRVRAGLLSAFARGRALADKAPGASVASYAEALQDQIRNFPDDPSAFESRWLLGRLRLARGETEDALALWAAIPPGRPRWLDSRLELARLARRELESLRLDGDHEAARKRCRERLDELDAWVKQAKPEGAVNDLTLEALRLALTPQAGNPAEAQKLVESLRRSALTPPQQSALRWLSLVALAQLSRFVEAESLIRKEARTADPGALLEPIRLLDRTAAETESDLRMRRIGLLLRLLIDHEQDQADRLPPALTAELPLRKARALLFSGDEAAARAAVSAAPPPAPDAGPDLLRDLAELYFRLDAFGMAEEVQRVRTRKVPPGSPSWFDARYGLALAFYRDGKAREALQLIDATAILHPELGGAALKTRFLALRQRIQPSG